MRLGNITLDMVSDGTFWTDGGGLFGLVPKVVWSKIAASDEQNRVLLQLRCLLITTETQRILVDTGYGDKLSGEYRDQVGLLDQRRLLHCLHELGITPPDIDLVINTHLHHDHCGGNTTYQNSELVPTFPRATYCIQRLEIADALYPNERTTAVYLRENFQPLERAGQLQVVSGDIRLTHTPAGGTVRLIVTPGHTRAHQCVVIESDGQTALFLGDVASWPIHLERLAWVPAYDVEPLVSIETKRRLAHWAIEHHALLIFQHHPEIVAGYLVPSERPDRFRLEPVEF